MAKSALRRLNTLRLRDKWLRILKNKYPDMDLNKVTFGRVHSKDPLDCGNPQCQICSADKVLRTKSRRLAQRRKEREVFLHEIDTDEQ